MNKKLILTAVAAAFLAAGCASKGTKPDNPNAIAGGGVDSGISTNGADSNGLGNGSAIGANGASATAGMLDLSKFTVYFDYDQSELKPESSSVIDNFGKYLSASASAKVRLEGNTDERGSREYNVALGERRAQSVASALKAKGATAAQLSVISYGEERPAASGHDEAAWAQNRRVDIVK